jgi:glycosyltransferase 2 family protein
MRAATLVCSLWVLGALVASGLALIFEVQGGLQTPAAPASLLPAAIFAAGSFVFRFLRWHTLARRVAPSLELADSFTIGTIGFALATTPGRVGEALKLMLLRTRAAVPVAVCAPVLLLEKIGEALGFALLSLIASFLLPWSEVFSGGQNLALVVAILVVVALAGSLRRPLLARAALMGPVLARMPLGGRLLLRPSLGKLWADLAQGGERVMGGSGLVLAVGLSFAARVCDGVVVFWVARLYGVDLPLAAACFIVGSAGFVGGLSMLPGGVGAVEATMIGLLLVFGEAPAASVAIVLTTRILIFWLWVALGLGLAVRYSMKSGMGSQASRVEDRPA